MSERDVMALLAEANPVRVEELPQVEVPESIFTPNRRSSRRVLLVAAAATAALTASLIAAFAFNGTSRRLSGGAFQLLPTPTLKHPLPPGAKQVTLSQATRTLGAPIVLPHASLAAPPDAGAVWAETPPGAALVAVTFPLAGLIVLYQHPAEFTDPAARFAAIAHGKPGFHVVELNGVAGLAIDQNSDSTGDNFGSIEFVSGGNSVTVMGRYDEATLRAVAQSIVDRSSSSSSNLPMLAEPGEAPTPVADAAAANALLPFKVVLPADTKPTSLGVFERSHQLDAYFDTPASGPYTLVEGLSTETVAMLEETAKRWTVGPIHEIDVVDGVEVLLQGWSDGSLVASWIREDGGSRILTWIEGPETAANGQVKGTFTKQQALAVAADIISQGG
jgi:hypothetical protein